MKKLLLFLIPIILIGCAKEKPCELKTLTYKIYYPNNVIIKTYTNNICRYYIGSDRGSNKISVWLENAEDSGYYTLEESTAPIEIISLK